MKKPCTRVANEYFVKNVYLSYQRVHRPPTCFMYVLQSPALLFTSLSVCFVAAECPEQDGQPPEQVQGE